MAGAAAAALAITVAEGRPESALTNESLAVIIIVLLFLAAAAAAAEEGQRMVCLRRLDHKRKCL